LISAIDRELKEVPIGVIEGDISSSIDAQLLEKQGIRAAQINTCGSATWTPRHPAGRGTSSTCGRDRFYENVGNLICPRVDLGEAVRLLAASVPEETTSF
jgi:hydrogenase nickel incorporation protein HypB